MLFIIWAVVGFVAEVPSGALADRFSRRAAVVSAGVFQAAGYMLWITLPGFWAFAGGFILWGLGGALASGAFEALVYEGLVEAGAKSHYATLQGRISAASLLAQIPTAAAATTLFALGGYALAGWVSVGCCLSAALLASRLPENRRRSLTAPPPHLSTPTQSHPHVETLLQPPLAAAPHTASGPYLLTLRQGLAEAAASRTVRFAVIAAALLGGLDAVEEYFSLLAKNWGVPKTAIPMMLLIIPAAGAAGAGLAGIARRFSAASVGLIFGGALTALAAAGLVGRPVGLAAVALFYGLYRMVLVVVDARLQEHIQGPFRATVTSVASLGTEVAAMALFGVWAVGGLTMVIILWLPVSVLLPFLLRPASITK